MTGARRAGAAAAWLALCAAPALAAEDVPGASDPPGIARFPGAWIVAYRGETPLRRYAFVTGRVDRSHRDMRMDRGERVAARLLQATYRLPDGTRLEDAVAHYVEAVQALGLPVAFTCRGRDCGRSTVWANDVFGVKELVAPDPAQFYLAASDGQTLLAIYVVQRGNRRVYAHVDRALREAPATEGAAALVARLRQDGFLVVPNVTPDAGGALPPPAVAALGELAERLAEEVADVHVVCHIAGPVAEAKPASERCGEQAAGVLAAAGIEATGYGAGPLLPRRGTPSRRLELVLASAEAP